MLRRRSPAVSLPRILYRVRPLLARLAFVPVFLLFLFAASTPATVPAPESSRETIIKLVAQIQRADYEGDRSALRRLFEQLAPFTSHEDLASRARYWRGFALWRRAMNGFNDSVDPKELGEDLQHAWDEFAEAGRNDPALVDAKIGALSCVTLLAFSINQDSPDRQKELLPQARQLMKEAQSAAPDNPRLLWVLGPNFWYSPAENGGGQIKAMELYQKGLETLRSRKSASADPLEPSWGEPELLMNLAWSNLNRAKPDLPAAEQYARSALKLVPYWHYVRDILLPQILEAKAKQT